MLEYLWGDALWQCRQHCDYLSTGERDGDIHKGIDFIYSYHLDEVSNVYIVVKTL